MHLPLAYLFGTHADASCAEEKPGNEVGVNSPKLEFLEGPPVSRTKTNSRKIKSNVFNRREHQAELGEVESGIDNRREHQKSAVANRIEHQTRLGEAKSGMANRKKHGTQFREVKLGVANRIEHQDQLAIVPVPTEDDPVTFEQYDSPLKTPDNFPQECVEFPIRSYSKKGYSVQRKNDFDEDMMFGSGWGGKSSGKKVQRARYQSTHLKRDDSCKPKTYKQTALSAGAYDKLISSYMTNFDPQSSQRRYRALLTSGRSLKPNTAQIRRRQWNLLWLRMMEKAQKLKCCGEKWNYA